MRRIARAWHWFEKTALVVSAFGYAYIAYQVLQGTTPHWLFIFVGLLSASYVLFEAALLGGKK